MRRSAIKSSKESVLMAALVENHYKNNLSFTCNGKHYEFKSLDHMLNTLNKLRKDQFKKNNK